MRFERPEYLFLLMLVFFLLILFWWVAHARKRALEQLGDSGLLVRLAESLSRKNRARKVGLVILATIFLVLTIAQPQYGKRLTLIKREGVDIIVAVDVSLSMLAEDVKPNRLELARREVTGLIDRLKGDRVALIAFAGNAFVQCPLTLDYGAARIFLEVINPNLIPEPGTAIGEAIRTAQGAFVQKERKYKILILITDGEDHETDPIGAARAAAREGVRIYTVGIGSITGDPIPLRDGKGNFLGFKKDENGEVVLSRLDEPTLQKIALETGGKYYHATAGGLELDRIYDEISRMEKKGLKGDYLTKHEDRFQYPLFIVLLLLSIEFFLTERRKLKVRSAEEIGRVEVRR